MDLVPFAAETSHVPFYILGGLLAAWAVVLAGFGLSKSDFPKAGAQMSGVIAVSVILFVAAVGAAIVTGSTPNEKLTADEKPTPSGVKLPPPAAATPTTAVAAPAAGGGGGAAAAGKQVFVSNGCGACHTLKEAGTSGAVGPNLDNAKPSQALVIARVTNGAGAMPSFKGRISAADLKALAAYLVQATGGNVRSNDDVEGTRFEPLDGLLAQRLTHIAVEGTTGVTTCLQALCQFDGSRLRAHEDDPGIAVFHFQNTGQGIKLVGATHLPIALADGRHGFRGTFDLDFHRLAQVRARNPVDGLGHGRRKQRHLALLRGVLENIFDSIDETHA